MNPIQPKQFLKEISEVDGAIMERGWTVLEVESGDRNAGVGASNRGLARAVLIRNDTRTATPVFKNYPKLAALVESGEWVFVSAPLKPGVELEQEPASTELVLHAAEKIRQQRNKTLTAEEQRRYNIIAPLLEELGRNIYFEHIRAPAMHKVAERHGITVVCVWQYLCLYWQFGKQIKGLRPRHALSGQKSLRTRVILHESSGKQIPFRAYKTGRKPQPGSDTGIAMGYSDVLKCRKGADMFIYKPSADHSLTYKWQFAHTKVKILYYDRIKNPESPAPTLKQFIWAVRTDPLFVKKSEKIVGRLPHARNRRQLRSTSRAGVMGPGQLLAFDDMVCKVVLLDDLTRLPIGTARVFIGVDVWSKMIAGAHDTLSGSSYREAMLGLYNVFRDKAVFFAEKNLQRTLRYFTTRGVFKNITTDNGPLGAAMADALPEDISDVSNVTGYRPDLKPDAETSFHAYLKQAAEELPGYNRTERTRGDNDPKMVAYLTQTEFRTILWKWIEIYNQRPLDGWLPAAAMREENPPGNTPYELWHWGLTNCAGQLEARSDDDLRKALLTRAEGTWTERRGIKFKGLVYVIDEKTADGLSANGVDPTGPVTIRYDDNYVSHIFAMVEGTSVVAQLRADLEEIFHGMTFALVDFHRPRLARKARFAKKQQDQGICELAALVAEIKKTAKAATNGNFRDERQRKQAVKAVSVDGVRKKAVARDQAERVKKIQELFTKGKVHPTTPPAPANQPKKHVTAKASMSAILDE